MDDEKYNEVSYLYGISKGPKELKVQKIRY